ncbi:hypothetical protein LCGC14_2012550 [marine sediment metagenome]|uniref:Uncharacterized protein n=1 Tax=marine sediment metagenome TaxID=412755 RepID=A0A0F9HX25_9ZZZZ
MRSIGSKSSYIRFFPNPGFSLRVSHNRWFHYCKACGFTLLRPKQGRRGKGRKTISVRKD